MGNDNPTTCYLHKKLDIHAFCTSWKSRRQVTHPAMHPSTQLAQFNLSQP